MNYQSHKPNVRWSSWASTWDALGSTGAMHKTRQWVCSRLSKTKRRYTWSVKQLQNSPIRQLIVYFFPHPLSNSTSTVFRYHANTAGRAMAIVFNLSRDRCLDNTSNSCHSAVSFRSKQNKQCTFRFGKYL